MHPLVQRTLYEVRTDLEADRLVLPMLPEIVLRVWRLAEDPRTTPELMAKTIGGDPGLSTRLLALANSAFYRGARPVADLRRATVRLGHRAIAQLVSVLAVAQLYDLRRYTLARPYLERLWADSTLVAGLAEALAPRVSTLDPGVALVAGLLHRIGALPVLARVDQLPPSALDPGQIEALVDALQTRVGKAIAEHWRLPREIADVIAGHAELTRERPPAVDYVDVVQAALLMAYRDTDHAWATLDWREIPAATALGLVAPAELDLGAVRDKTTVLRGLVATHAA